MSSLSLAPVSVGRDAAALKQQLLQLLEIPQPVVIDAAKVEQIDTPTLQLLYAFERDRAAADRQVEWRECSTQFQAAVALLGLTLGSGAVAAH